MKSILFIDSACYKPYTCNTLRGEALGGTEATVLRVARAMAKDGLDVSLYQHCDDSRATELIDGIRHIGMASEFPTPDVVVHLRTARELPVWRGLYPSARHLVWMHDLGGEWLKDEPLTKEMELIYVSQFHAEQFEDALIEHKGMDASCKQPSQHVLYNPVEIDGLQYPKVKGRLGFFSSPHKGLHQVIAAFQAMRSRHGMSDLTLVVGNPGYMGQLEGDKAPEGVTFLGELAHHRVMEEMSRCEVLFYPQTVFGETFGLVLAESSAMGTAVLAHDFGAAKEVLGQGGPHAVIDCTNEELVCSELTRLLAEQPIVRADPRFSIGAVIADWRKLLEGN